MAKLVVYADDASNSVLFDSSSDRLVSRVFNDEFTVNVPNSIYTYTYRNPSIAANRTLIHMILLNPASDSDSVNVAYPHEVIATANGYVDIKLKYFSTSLAKSCKFKLVGYRT